MIYTIGHQESYEKYFKEQGTPKKLGRDSGDGYLGGWVWATREEAQRQCPSDYQVYGVNADWGKDTVSADNSGVPGMHFLLVDSDLVDLSNRAGSMDAKTVIQGCFREIGFDNNMWPDRATETIFFLKPACVDDTPGSRRMEKVSPEAVEEFVAYWQNQIDVARDYIKNGQNPNTHEWK